MWRGQPGSSPQLRPRLIPDATTGRGVTFPGFRSLSCMVEGDTVMSPGTVVLVTRHEAFEQAAEGLAGRESLVNVNHHA